MLVNVDETLVASSEDWVLNGTVHPDGHSASLAGLDGFQDIVTKDIIWSNGIRWASTQVANASEESERSYHRWENTYQDGLTESSDSSWTVPRSHREDAGELKMMNSSTYPLVHDLTSLDSVHREERSGGGTWGLATWTFRIVLLLCVAASAGLVVWSVQQVAHRDSTNHSSNVSILRSDGYMPMPPSLHRPTSLRLHAPYLEGVVTTSISCPVCCSAYALDC